MESFNPLSNSVKGTEILRFEHAELSKVKSGSSSFSAFGPLSVLYFKDYSRFVLQINDWRYPLLRRLPITATASTIVGDETSTRFILPALNGFTFHLKITSPAGSGSEALGNLETIFSNNAHFSFAGQQPKKLSASPDDKLTRAPKKSADTGMKEVITEKIKSVTTKVNNKVATLKTGTKYLTSTKKKINPADIKTKNFRKTARPTFKKDFFKSSEKLTGEFSKLRSDNANMKEAREMDSLKKSSGASLYVNKIVLEEAILNNKDIVSVKPESLKSEIKSTVRDMTSGRHVQKPVEMEAKKEVGFESMHYQG